MHWLVPCIGRGKTQNQMSMCGLSWAEGQDLICFKWSLLGFIGLIHVRLVRCLSKVPRILAVHLVLFCLDVAIFGYKSSLCSFLPWSLGLWLFMIKEPHWTGWSTMDRRTSKFYLVSIPEKDEPNSFEAFVFDILHTLCGLVVWGLSLGRFKSSLSSNCERREYNRSQIRNGVPLLGFIPLFI